MQVFKCMKYSCIRRVYYIKGISVYIDTCTVTFDATEIFVESLIKFSVGIWIPMVIIILCHIAMYLKLQQQARFRSQSANDPNTTNTQMQVISRKFLLIVCVFYICMLPGTSIWLHYTYLLYTKQAESGDEKYFYDMGVDILWAILNISCCLNPFIYGQLHSKLLVFIRKKIATSPTTNAATKAKTTANILTTTTNSTTNTENRSSVTPQI